jgi:flagellar basal body rod protein FlgC
MDISGSALTAQRLRMDIISENHANADYYGNRHGRALPQESLRVEERSADSFSNAFVKA